MKVFKIDDGANDDSDRGDNKLCSQAQASYSLD